MNIEAIHKGDNPVKVTRTMMNNLNVFSVRQMKLKEIEKELKRYDENIKQLDYRYGEVSANVNLEDRKLSKEASKELKNIDKERNELYRKLEKLNFEKEKLIHEQKEVLSNLPNVSIISGEKENEIQDSLSSELNEFSFELPTTTEKIEISDNPEQSDVEVPEFQWNNFDLKEPEIPEVQWDNIEHKNQSEDLLRRVPEVEPIDDDRNKMEVIDNLISNLKNQPEIDVDFDEIDDEDSFEIVIPDALPYDQELDLEVVIDDEEKQDESQEAKVEQTVEAQEQSIEEEKTEEDEMPVDAEITLKDYVKFPSYQAWLFAFAEDAYGKNSFTKEEFDELEKKEHFVTERRFNSGRAKQAISLTEENKKLIEKTRQAIVSKNASQTLAKNLTDELNDTKTKLDELNEKYDVQTNNLQDVENKLKETTEELNKTKEQLDTISKELDNYKNTFNKMRGIIEISTNDKEKKEKKNKKGKQE